MLGSRSTSQWLLLKSSRTLPELTGLCATALQEIPSAVHEVMGGEHGEADGSESGDTDEEDGDTDEEDAENSEEGGEADGEDAEADEGSGGHEEEADSSDEEESGDGGKQTNDSSGGSDEVVPNSPDQSRQSRVLYSPTPSRRRLKPASPGQASFYLQILFRSLTVHMKPQPCLVELLLSIQGRAVACCDASMTEISGHAGTSYLMLVVLHFLTVARFFQIACACRHRSVVMLTLSSCNSTPTA